MPRFRLRSFRQSAIHPAGLNFDGDFKLTVDRVEVRGTVFSVIHCDNDSKEAADFGHAANFTPRPCCCLTLRFSGRALTHETWCTCIMKWRTCTTYATGYDGPLQPLVRRLAHRPSRVTP